MLFIMESSKQEVSVVAGLAQGLLSKSVFLNLHFA